MHIHIYIQTDRQSDRKRQTHTETYITQCSNTWNTFFLFTLVGIDTDEYSSENIDCGFAPGYMMDKIIVIHCSIVLHMAIVTTIG